MAPWVKYGEAALEYLASLPARLPGVTIAVELRDASWLPRHTEEPLAWLRDHGLTYVSVDAPRTPASVDDTVALTETGERWAANFGIGADALRAKRRPLCRLCLDWSERRGHLSGALGAAVLQRFLSVGFVRRAPSGRTLLVSPAGAAFVERVEPKIGMSFRSIAI